MRALIRTLMAGESVLEALATDGASMPVTVIAGCDQMRPRIGPEPIGVTPSSRPASSRSFSSGYAGVSAVVAREPLDGDRAVVVVQRGEQADRGEHRIRHRSPEHPGVRGVVEGANREAEGDVAAQPDGEGGSVDVPVVGVGDDDHVGGELVLVLGEEVGERARAELLLALDEDREAQVEVGADRLDEGADRRDVGEHAGLVVGGAPAVQPVAANGRLERR